MLGDTTGQATGTLGAGQRRTRSPGLWDSEEKPSGGAVYTAVRCAGRERISEAFLKGGRSP